MKRHCVVNCKPGIGLQPKQEKIIKNIYYGNVQNGYEKGDIFDANATIDQIQYYLKQYDDSHISPESKIITFTVTLPDSPKFNTVYNNIVDWDQDITNIDKYSAIRIIDGNTKMSASFIISGDSLVLTAFEDVKNSSKTISIVVLDINDSINKNTETVVYNNNWNTL